jgi:hypothetical protein
MRRHLIIEGMDGSGKDSLINNLVMAHPSYTLHERASTSLGGPVADLVGWTERSVIEIANQRTDSPRYIFNRHPLISEPIYAPYRMINAGLRGKFRDVQWLRLQRSIVGGHAILVICDPGWSEVHKNLINTADGHMAGVIDNAHTIYQHYQEFQWPGPVIRYSYKRDNPDLLLTTISIMRQNKAL